MIESPIDHLLNYINKINKKNYLTYIFYDVILKTGKQ